MTVLMNKTTQQQLIANLEVASSYWSPKRVKGLMGRKSLASDSALWIHYCNSIHTYFMKFAIDCVFVDKNLRVKKVYHGVRPGRLVLPVWGASSVIEMAAGVAQEKKIQVGDLLHVGT